MPDPPPRSHRTCHLLSIQTVRWLARDRSGALVLGEPHEHSVRDVRPQVVELLLVALLELRRGIPLLLVAGLSASTKFIHALYIRPRGNNCNQAKEVFISLVAAT